MRTCTSYVFVCIVSKSYIDIVLSTLLCTFRTCCFGNIVVTWNGFELWMPFNTRVIPELENACANAMVLKSFCAWAWHVVCSYDNVWPWGAIDGLMTTMLYIMLCILAGDEMATWWWGLTLSWQCDLCPMSLTIFAVHCGFLSSLWCLDKNQNRKAVVHWFVVVKNNN